MTDILAVLDILGVAWCILNFFWAWLRGHAADAAVYAIALFGGLVVALNIGGVLDHESWSYFTMTVFAAEIVFRLWKGPFWRVPLAGAMLVMSIIGSVV